MRISIEPQARSWLARQLARSLRCAVIQAVALTSAAMFLPASWADQVLAAAGILAGAVGAILLYATWGSASCLADIAVWATALLAASGGFALQYVACSIIQEAVSAGLTPDVPVACVPNYLRANVYGNALALLSGTFVAWVAMRYLTWKARASS